MARDSSSARVAGLLFNWKAPVNGTEAAIGSIPALLSEAASASQVSPPISSDAEVSQSGAVESRPHGSLALGRRRRGRGVHPHKRRRYCHFQHRQIVLIHLPDHHRIEVVVGVAQVVSDPADIPPRNAGTQYFGLGSQPLRRLTDNQKRIVAGENRPLVIEKLYRSHILQKAFDVPDILKNIAEAIARVTKRQAQPRAQR